MRKFVPVFSLILTLALGACRGSGTNTPAPTQSEVQQTAEVQTSAGTTPQVQAGSPQPYPSPQPYVSPTPRSYPGPEGNIKIFTPTPLVVPTAGADTGVVTGKLINIETGEPIAFQSVYLGKKNYLTPGPGYTYTLQEFSSPHSISDEEGRFAIGAVPPNEYILMIFTPFGATVVMQPNTDRELEVIVRAGEVLDLGTMEAIEPELR